MGLSAVAQIIETSSSSGSWGTAGLTEGLINPIPYTCLELDGARSLEVRGRDAAVRVGDVGRLRPQRLAADGLQRLAQRPRDARQEAHHLRWTGIT